MRGLKKFFFSLLFLIAVSLYQNCTPPAKFSKIPLYSTEVLSFSSNTKLENGRPINVILFIDTSNSMSGIKEPFKQSLSDFLETLKDANVNLGVYDLNSHLTKSSTYEAPNEEGVMVSMTWAQLTLSAAGGTVFNEIDSLSFSYGNLFNPTLSSYSPSRFNFTSLMSEEDRASTLDSIKAKIDKLFEQALYSTNFGDAGLCGILRAANDISNGKSPFTVNSTTPTVFMLLSNEDDESKLIDLDWLETNYQNGLGSHLCAPKIIAQRQVTKNSNFYLMDGFYYKVGIQADYIVDGASLTANFTLFANSTPTDYIPYSADLEEGADCLSIVDINGNNILTRIKSYHNYYKWTFSGNESIQTCTIGRNSTLRVSSTIISAITLATGKSLQNDDLCPEIEAAPPIQGIPQSCRRIIPSGFSTQFKKYLAREIFVAEDSVAHQADDMGLAITNLIQSKLIANNFYFTTVINSADGQCSMTDGSRLGTKYEGLAQRFAANGDIIPICSTDYSEKIMQVAEKILITPTGEVEIPTEILAIMSRFDVKRGSQIITPDSSQYELKDDRIIFTPGYLQANDVIRIFTTEQIN